MSLIAIGHRGVRRRAWIGGGGSDVFGRVLPELCHSRLEPSEIEVNSFGVKGWAQSLTVTVTCTRKEVATNHLAALRFLSIAKNVSMIHQ
jgi:hypothetical protein